MGKVVLLPSVFDRGTFNALCKALFVPEMHPSEMELARGKEVLRTRVTQFTRGLCTTYLKKWYMNVKKGETLELSNRERLPSPWGQWCRAQNLKESNRLGSHA